MLYIIYHFDGSVTAAAVMFVVRLTRSLFFRAYLYIMVLVVETDIYDVLSGMTCALVSYVLYHNRDVVVEDSITRARLHCCCIMAKRVSAE